MRLYWKLWHLRLAQFTAGGRWTDRLLPAARRSLRWFWFDGIFAQASESIIVTYLPLFVLALGASRAQIGLMNSLSNLSAALLLLPGAALVERLGHRREIVVYSGGGVTRVAILALALLPFLIGGPPAVAIAVALVVIRNIAANLGMPAWTSLTADIVPMAWRGRYFASRNMAMTVVGMVATFAMGYVITRIGGLTGYQLALGVAFLIGMAATFCFARIEEPPAGAPPVGAPGRHSILGHLRAHPGFLSFCAAAALWNFSLNIAGPFFSVYLVQGLKATASIVGVLSVVSSLAALPGQRLFGMLSDRWGARRVQMLTGLLIPLLPLGWSLARSPWHVIPIDIAGGFLWAGYNLASFNFLLEFTPEDYRPRYSAIYQTVIMAALAGGAYLGGLLADRWGYITIFLISSAGRLAAALFFARFVRSRAIE